MSYGRAALIPKQLLTAETLHEVGLPAHGAVKIQGGESCRS